MAQSNTAAGFPPITRVGIGAPLLLVLMLGMLILPLPAILLDILFTFNITFAMVVLLSGIYSSKPLDFAVFPTVLLIATLMRLALNVASTRVVLMDGHTGTDAAGKVIEAFGEFVIGGDFAVGIVVFIILIIINFIVVTKGSSRISEVSARFTLDAMPGKQMAIDADLNAGILTQEEAKQRRLEIAKEADFYGAMDGASKFVRGDAIAGILILFINLIGGISIGMFQHGLSFATAAHNYSLLTIGDGLVAQIPALVLSTAAAIMVTRMSREHDMGEQMISQLFGNPRVLFVTAGVLTIIGIIPGMPNLAFLSMALVTGGIAYLLTQRRRREVLQAEPETKSKPQNELTSEQRELGWDDLTPVDTIGLEVGYRLIPLVDKAQGGQLMNRIKGVRKKLTQELGFLIPSVHIRDNLDLSPNAYRISLMGVSVTEAEIYPERELAINPGQVYGTIQGIPGKDPAFGLAAVWINPGQRDEAQTLGYTVVDASTVVATHLNQILQEHGHQLLGREEVQHLLNNLAKTSPKLVEDLVPNILPLGVVVKVLQNLLEENVPIRDIRTIAESLADTATKSQDPATLTELVRTAIGRVIIQKINGLQSEIPVMVLEPQLEQLLQTSMQTTGDGFPVIEPGLVEQMQKGLAQAVQKQEMTGQPAVLLVSSSIRAALSKYFRRMIRGLHILAYSEVPDNKSIRIVATIGK